VARSIFSIDAYHAVSKAIEEFGPEVVHFQNTFPLISTAAVVAAYRAGVATVMSLPNYRMICPAACLFRAGRLCTECVGRRLAMPGIMHGCYRGSRLGTAAVAAASIAHRLCRGMVDMLIALGEEQRGYLIRGGLPADRIAVKP
jgi:hypothetical protein